MRISGLPFPPFLSASCIRHPCHDSIIIQGRREAQRKGKDQHEVGSQLREATDIIIHLVSGFDVKDASEKESNSKAKIGETSRASFETVDSAEDAYRGKTCVR